MKIPPGVELVGPGSPQPPLPDDVPKAKPRGKRVSMTKLRPRAVPKHVKLLVRAGVKIPPKHVAYTKANMEHVKIRDRVAVCRGLAKPVRGCEWEVVSVHDRGKTAKAEQAVRDASPELGVALVLLDSGDKAIKLISEKGEVLAP